jgi:hypothetical protein
MVINIKRFKNFFFGGRLKEEQDPDRDPHANGTVRIRSGSGSV